MFLFRSLWEEELALNAGLDSMSVISKGIYLYKLRDDYSMQPMLPKKQGICDHCGGKLITRDDDTEKVIKARMREYNEKTKPLID